MNLRGKIDYTKTNDITRHRYRFWCTFPNGEVLRNELAVPGSIPAKDADVMAQLAWIESVRGMIGRRLPRPEQPVVRHGSLVNARITAGMADHAAQNASYSVARPGETEYSA